MKALDARAAWRIAFGAWRRANRRFAQNTHTVDDWCAWSCKLREIQHNWQLPYRVTGAWEQQETSTRTGRIRKSWCGPSRSGQLALRRWNEADQLRIRYRGDLEAANDAHSLAA